MTRSLLSDDETETLMHLSAGGNHVGVVKYVNKLLHLKGMGTDPCARPFAMRSNQKLDPPCFALGYLEVVSSFMKESHARSPKTVVKDVDKFIHNLRLEIIKFFKEEPCQKT